jgi:nitrogen fixation NifU-like protein
MNTDTETAAELDLYQDVVMDHKRTPRHFGTLPAPTHQARGQNPQCGDDLQVALVVDHGRVSDIRFHGQGCAICIASASMMTEAVLGQEVAAAQAMQAHFRAVLTGQREPEAAHLGKLISLAGVRRYPGRIKCALLGWHALMHALADPTTEGATGDVRPNNAPKAAP